MKFPFNMWNDNNVKYEIPNSYVKGLGSKFHVWSIDARNICFTYEMEDANIKSNFTEETFISHTELKHFLQVKYNFHMWYDMWICR